MKKRVTIKEPKYFATGMQFGITTKGCLEPEPEAEQVYLLAQIKAGQVLLIHVASGNRYIDEPLKVESVSQISKSAFHKHFRYSVYSTPWRYLGS